MPPATRAAESGFRAQRREEVGQAVGKASGKRLQGLSNLQLTTRKYVRCTSHGDEFLRCKAGTGFSLLVLSDLQLLKEGTSCDHSCFTGEGMRSGR